MNAFQVITAAHCFDSALVEPSNCIVFGNVNVAAPIKASNLPLLKRQYPIYHIKSVKKHSKYNKKWNLYDIAIATIAFDPLGIYLSDFPVVKLEDEYSHPSSTFKKKL